MSETGSGQLDLAVAAARSAAMSRLQPMAILASSTSTWLSSRSCLSLFTCSVDSLSAACMSSCIRILPVVLRYRKAVHLTQPSPCLQGEAECEKEFWRHSRPRHVGKYKKSATFQSQENCSPSRRDPTMSCLACSGEYSCFGCQDSSHSPMSLTLVVEIIFNRQQYSTCRAACQARSPIASLSEAGFNSCTQPRVVSFCENADVCDTVASSDEDMYHARESERMKHRMI